MVLNLVLFCHHLIIYDMITTYLPSLIQEQFSYGKVRCSSMPRRGFLIVQLVDGKKNFLKLCQLLIYGFYGLSLLMFLTFLSCTYSTWGFAASLLPLCIWSYNVHQN